MFSGHGTRPAERRGASLRTRAKSSMPLRAPGTDARISKAKKMREVENQRQHRERLRTMLMQKLTVKYGRGRNSGANKTIAGEVNRFMEAKDAAPISEPDLVMLEKGIVARIDVDDAAAPGKALRPTNAAARVRADADRLRAEMDHGVATAKAAGGRPPG